MGPGVWSKNTKPQDPYEVVVFAIRPNLRTHKKHSQRPPVFFLGQPLIFIYIGGHKKVPLMTSIFHFIWNSPKVFLP